MNCPTEGGDPMRALLWHRFSYLSFHQPILNCGSLRNRKELSPHQDACWYSWIYLEMVCRSGTYCHTNWYFKSAFIGGSQIGGFISPVCRIEASFPQWAAYSTGHAFLTFRARHSDQGAGVTALLSAFPSGQSLGPGSILVWSAEWNTCPRVRDGRSEGGRQRSCGKESHVHSSL